MNNNPSKATKYIENSSSSSLLLFPAAGAALETDLSQTDSDLQLAQPVPHD